MWVNITVEKGVDTYKKTVEAMKGFCAKIRGNWAAGIEVYQRDVHYGNNWMPEKLNFMLLSNAMKNCDKIDWGFGAEVTVTMEYDAGGGEQEAYSFQTHFVTASGPDDVKALELLVAALNAWVEEDIFPNARMAIDTKELLLRTELQDYLMEHGFNGYIVSKTKHPELKQ